MRTLVDIGDAEVKALDQIASEQKVSRAALIRQAIDGFLKVQARKTEGDAFGLWGDHAIDGLAYQEDLRREW
ncbi:ribbon-helix-helix protein, CopG family [Rhizobium sp. CG5]|uniref:ribbon-helix-helix domain-containing protein n=1 Tax=Rhizobium sp. CG5 TaxID=2726076 RepID=UPI0020349681|nr:CopG family transcriptional regulator [Rhizobium sp. CG5]MCM2475955.1 ribbon-helix-helix protein, CopG family [Rhizobium sp. CG5]